MKNINKNYRKSNIQADIFNTKKYISKNNLMNESLNAIKNTNSNNFISQNNLGLSLMKLNNFKEAEIAFRKAIKLNPNVSEIYYNLGIVLYTQNNVTDAINSYKKALQINPKYSECYNSIGLIFFDKSNFKEAQVFFNTAITLNPKYAMAHYNLGNCLKKLGHFKKAKLSFYKAIKLKKNFIEAYNNLGNTFNELGEIEKSIIIFIKAINQIPEYRQAWDNLYFSLEALRFLENDKKVIDIIKRKIEKKNVWYHILNYKLKIDKDKPENFQKKIINQLKRLKKPNIINLNYKKKECKSLDNIIAMVHFGRSGTGLLHSLIDNHKQITSLPSIYFSEFFDKSNWDKIRSNNIKEMVNNFVDIYPVLFDARSGFPINSKHGKKIERIGIKEGMTSLGDSKEEFLFLDKKLFKSNLEKLLSDTKEIDELIFFNLVNKAYEITLSNNKKTNIFYHIHNPDFYAKLNFKSLVNNCKWLMMVRDPIDSCESWVQKAFLENNYKDVVSKIVTMLYDIDNDIFLNENVIGLRLEDLKTKPKYILPKLCQWMKVKEEETMFEMTSQGKKWWGDESSPTQDAFGKLSNAKLSTVFNKEDRLILETLFYPFNIRFGYRKKNMKLFKYNLKQIKNNLNNLFNFEKEILKNLKIQKEEFIKTGTYLYFRSKLIQRLNTLIEYNTYPNMITPMKSN